MWYKTKTILQKNNLTEQRKNITDKTRMSPDPQQQKKELCQKQIDCPYFPVRRPLRNTKQ